MANARELGPGHVYSPARVYSVELYQFAYVDVMARAPARMALPSHNRVCFFVSNSGLPRVRGSFSLALALRSPCLSPSPSSSLLRSSSSVHCQLPPPIMSDMPPLHEFLQTVFARIKAGETGDSELATWRNTARELVDRTLDVSSSCPGRAL